jgi:serine/threonine protein kinase
MEYKNEKLYLGNSRLSNGSHFIQLNQITYYIDELNSDKPSGKGGNSSTFKIWNEETSEKFIKICNYPISIDTNLQRNGKYNKRIQRFQREINALEIASQIIPGKSVDVIESGEYELNFNGTKYIFLYYIMEKASCDLKEYLDCNEIALDQKLVLIKSILSIFNSLHEIGIYHRDIKPDNFLMFENICKIGDFGLVAFRNQDNRIDNKEYKIGPWGFLSPEAANRYVASMKCADYKAISTIDDSSDRFQLGLLFWYIFNYEVPMGIIQKEDLNITVENSGLNLDVIFETIISLFQFRKDRRLSFNEINDKISQLIP